MDAHTNLPYKKYNRIKYNKRKKKENTGRSDANKWFCQ